MSALKNMFEKARAALSRDPDSPLIPATRMTTDFYPAADSSRLVRAFAGKQFNGLWSLFMESADAAAGGVSSVHWDMSANGFVSFPNRNLTTAQAIRRLAEAERDMTKNLTDKAPARKAPGEDIHYRDALKLLPQARNIPLPK